ncbi:hypothetical protein PR048_022624 [Dryococelus australis]|uniref:Uncharacterized protein n=1 Tax=Dryococelus australis TaxID=614101 RepID=A0ABQ9H1L6_9NEOP|nr:hypothetical protein PR048_022624 [Dryococelus australis]
MGNSNSALKHHVETAKKTGVLKLSQGNLSEFPSSFKQLEPLLRTLDISENKFATLPIDISNFKLLKHLNVSQNRLISLPESLGSLSKLESLSACSNKITYIPQTLAQLTHLKQVYLSDNQITDFPVVFCSLKMLDVLDVSRNKISNVPDRVCELQVTELNLNRNQISSVSVKIADCLKLKTLRLEENCLQLSGVHTRILTDSKISVLALDGNLFDKRDLAELEGYEKYMDRYTAVKKKLASKIARCDHFLSAIDYWNVGNYCVQCEFRQLEDCSRSASVQSSAAMGMVTLLASHQGEPGFSPGGVGPRFSHVGIVSDDGTGLRIFSGLSCFPLPFILVLLHPHLASPSALAWSPDVPQGCGLCLVTHNSNSTSTVVAIFCFVLLCDKYPCQVQVLTQALGTPSDVRVRHVLYWIYSIIGRMSSQHDWLQRLRVDLLRQDHAPVQQAREIEVPSDADTSPRPFSADNSGECVFLVQIALTCSYQLHKIDLVNIHRMAPLVLIAAVWDIMVYTCMLFAVQLPSSGFLLPAALCLIVQYVHGCLMDHGWVMCFSLVRCLPGKQPVNVSATEHYETSLMLGSLWSGGQITCHRGEPGSMPLVWKVFLEFLHFACSCCIPALLLTHLVSPSSALETSMLRSVCISSLFIHRCSVVLVDAPPPPGGGGGVGGVD